VKLVVGLKSIVVSASKLLFIPENLLKVDFEKVFVKFAIFMF
jgi:hypothetical protein